VTLVALDTIIVLLYLLTYLLTYYKVLLIYKIACEVQLALYKDLSESLLYIVGLLRYQTGYANRLPEAIVTTSSL